jgi:glycosyltransferase involved in cell wall biosynthesis
MVAPVYILLGVEAVMEFILTRIEYQKTIYRLMSASILLFCLLFCAFWIFFDHITWTTTILFAVSLFRALNIMRFGYGRMRQGYLKKVVSRSSWRLTILQIISFLLVYLVVNQPTILVPLLLGSSLLGLCLMLKSLLNNIRPTKIVDVDITGNDVPVVTVAIPARNETDDMAACIQSILESDYPKLEVLVLDDCSHDQTPEVIRQFAHAGVRFIQGEEPENGWLAKNSAYQRLSDEATGEYILFCGVDIRFDSGGITDLINYMCSKKLNMISLLPRRVRHIQQALFFQAARYGWEIVLPRFLDKERPPALSSCWMVKKSFLGAGGFKAVSHSVMPERFFARKASAINSYNFLANRNLKLAHSHKTAKQQHQTAIRLRYPQLRKRPENVALYLMSLVWLFFLPSTLLLSGLISSIPMSWAISSITIILCWSIISYKLFTVVTGRTVATVLAVIFPLVILVDIYTCLISLWRYEFGQIEWKGRNVCLPIMHVLPKLPEIE